MITILFITFCFYLVAELIKQGTAAKARKREAARQAAVPRKHEEQITKLTAKVEQCEEDILQWQNQREQLIDYQEYLERERDACIGGSKQWHKWNNKCITNNSKVYGLDTRIRKAFYAKTEAERKISGEAI